MLRQKVKDFKSYPAVCLEDLVPKNNFYRYALAHYPGLSGRGDPLFRWRHDPPD